MWTQLNDFLRELTEAFRYMCGHRSIDIVEQSPNKLVLRSNFTQVVADKRAGVVKIDQRTQVEFASIRSIDIIHKHQTGDQAERWTVRLNINWRNTPIVGESTDPTDASIAAARLSTITDKNVRSL